MPETVVVRGSGGSIFEMDVPTRVHAAELFWQRVQSGDLTIITDPVEWVDVPGGGRTLQIATTPTLPAATAATPERRKPGRPPKVRPEEPEEATTPDEE